MRRLVWDPAPGETRTALIENGEVVELRLIRQVGQMAAPGNFAKARLVSRLGNGRALVLLDSGEEALLHPVPPLAEGASLEVEIVRARLPEPGRWKRALARPHEAGIAMTAPPPFADCDEILCPDAHAANGLGLGSGHPAIRVDAGAVADVDFDGLLDQARSGIVPFPGGELSIERTRAMTVIDVDGTLPPLDLNLAAARAVGAALRLFGISGPVGVDFVSVGSRADRHRIDAELAAACAPLGPMERTAMNGFGFVQLVCPRTSLSVAEILCGTTPGRLSVETQALLLLRAAARATGVGAREIMARPPVIDQLRLWPDLLDEAAHRIGASLKLVPDPGLIGYGHVHVSQTR